MPTHRKIRATTLHDTPLAGLPREGVRLLGMGAVGKHHLLHTSRTLFDATSHVPPEHAERCARVGLGLMLQAWVDDPLDGGLAESIRSIHGRHAYLFDPIPPVLAEALSTVASTWNMPEEDLEFLALFEQRDAEAALSYLDKELVSSNHLLYRLNQARQLAGIFGRSEWLVDRIRNLPLNNGALVSKILGDALFLAGELDDAVASYDAIEGGAEWPGLLFRRGNALARAGRLDDARESWRQSVERSPWLINALLVLHDAVSRADRSVARVPESCAVLLYCFDKSGELDATLDSLFAGEIGGSKVLVLDNGSGAETRDMLAGWTSRISAERLEVMRAPINVGAPGARNWLIREVVERGYEWTAFLDDDVELPADWLGRLSAAAKAYPEAGVWGAKVVNATVREAIQGADFTLEPDPGEQPSLGAQGEKVPSLLALSALHHFDPDYGQFRYMRPCASVMGCCHLFRTSTLEKSGGFDLRFSPSQFDDVDHDLGLLAAGTAPVYQGHLAVGHRRPFPHLANITWEQAKAAEANHYKLRAKHTAHMAKLLSKQEALLLDDINAKWRRLMDGGVIALGR